MKKTTTTHGKLLLKHEVLRKLQDVELELVAAGLCITASTTGTSIPTAPSNLRG